MKKQTRLSITLILCTLALLLSSCGKQAHVHEYSDWQTILEATCTANGAQKRKCKTCSNTETSPIQPKGHQFGEWVQTTEYDYHACSVCGFREFQYIQHTGNAGSNAQPSTPIIMGDYPNFDMFLQDCKETKSGIFYNGTHTSFRANLSDGMYSCDNYVIRIPFHINNVEFIGSLTGDPFQNVKIIIEDRTTPINITFKDILIESNDIILESRSRNIDVNINTMGEKCSFIVTSAASGSSGKNKDSVTEEAGHGENGANGKSAMFINGHCIFTCSAQNTVIKGGDGGNGGNGGTIIGGLMFGAGGNGGNGGNGANAIQGENLADVYVIGNKVVTITGGLGGNGGKGGVGKGFDSIAPNGATGANGTNGVSGCKDFVYQ